MRTFREQLIGLKACPEAVAWVGERTLEQAWTECNRSDWMAWLTRKCELDSREAAADMAERVWHLVKPEAQLACAWVIDCARRGADREEMDAAYGAAAAAAYGAAEAARAARAAYAAYDAAYAAAYGAAYDAAYDAARAARAAYAADAADAAYAAARKAERAAQADIMRSHFTWQDIERAMP